MKQAQAGHLVTHPLKAEGGDASEDGTGRGVPLTVQSIGTRPYSDGGAEDRLVARALTNRGGQRLDVETENFVPTKTRVRRLMPIECERLQGLPDGWTAYDAEGKPLKDGPRYRLIGNSVAIPCLEWIASRLVAVDAGVDPNTQSWEPPEHPQW